MGRERFQPRKKWKKQEFPTYARKQGGDCAPHRSHCSAPLRGGGVFRAPARPTFALGGKSGQKRRSNLRFENPLTPRTWGFAILCPTRTRQDENHPKCGIDLLLSPLPLKIQNVDLRTGAFQSKSGSAQRNTSVQHFGRIRTHRQAAEGNPKTMGFWRRSFPHFFRC